MIVINEKGVAGVICHTIHQYEKAKNKYMKDYDKDKELPYLKYVDQNNLYDWEMSEKLAVNNFARIKDTSKLIKIYKKWWRINFRSWYSKSWKKYMKNNFIMIRHFNQKKGNWKSRKVCY